MHEMHLQPGPPFRTLIVEDSAEDRELFRRILRRNGNTFVIYEAANVNEGLRIAREEQIDCIILDYQLPDGDGIDFIHRYQEEQGAAKAAIVMVTGRGSERTAVEAMKMGALDYITKGSLLEGFFTQIILNAIERQHLKDEIARYQHELEKSYRALSEFTHTASHDLKAPLRHISSYCDMIREDFAERLGPDGAEYVERLGVNARRMQSLIDELLAYSEVMNARAEKDAVDCKAVVAEVIEMQEEAIREAGATVTCGELPSFQGYPLRVRQLFQNLISNAVKYRSKERPLEVSVTAEDRGGDYLFSVKDNGMGMEAQYQEVIFQPFKRLHAQDEIEGTGLGLSICRKIAELHGGRIWAESAPGRGTTFFFTIAKPEARRGTVFGTA